MKTIVGLYKDTTTANQVIKELVNYGITQDIISLVTGNPRTDLRETLTSAGVAATEADAYVEGVRQGGSLVSVQAEDDEANDVVAIMNRYNPVDVHNLSAAFTKSTTQQTTGKPASKVDTTKQAVNEQGDMSIPIVEEEINVGKRQVEQGGVRVHTRLEEQPVEQQVTLHKEEVHVERRPVNRVADASDLTAFQEGSFELKETNEEAVVEKRARVVEEVVIKKEGSDRTETVRDTVRKTKVDVDQTGGLAQSGQTSFDASTFRTDYQTKYAKSGRTFEQYQPAYQYGYTLANDARYTGRNWNDVEADARTSWTKNNQGSAWADFKDAVRHGWEQTKRAVSH